ncbi:hypothetical protein QFC24_005367 [Naganishia onofrii]|uniref:Uncharacterized protein n=1 Tax=Naganishia onofrii TaxID=1851511 RepID=A0ACC2X9Y3_9TREE|nr:hypothetical protein QFC24_005367 [Naganishia onofrii]
MTIKAVARQVDAAGSWDPRFGMVDKDRAEVNALKTIFGARFPIRLCQFHVMQAIRRWDKGRAASEKLARRESAQIEEQSENHGSFSTRKVKKTDNVNGNKRARKASTKIADGKKAILDPSLPKEAMSELLELFRKLQRYRAENLDWQSCRDQFEVGVKGMCSRYELVSKMPNVIMEYFETNWFTDFWRDLWTDNGLPQGDSRDGPLNTNNYIESAFRTFKLVFLGGRKNKRIDRLLEILITDFFPYYALWPPTAARPSKKLLTVTGQGYDLWKRSTFRQVKEGERTSWYITRQAGFVMVCASATIAECVLSTIPLTIDEIHRLSKQQTKPKGKPVPLSIEQRIGEEMLWQQYSEDEVKFSESLWSIQQNQPNEGFPPPMSSEECGVGPMEDQLIGQYLDGEEELQEYRPKLSINWASPDKELKRAQSNDFALPIHGKKSGISAKNVPIRSSPRKAKRKRQVSDDGSSEDVDEKTAMNRIFEEANRKAFIAESAKPKKTATKPTTNKSTNLPTFTVSVSFGVNISNLAKQWAAATEMFPPDWFQQSHEVARGQNVRVLNPFDLSLGTQEDVLDLLDNLFTKCEKRNEMKWLPKDVFESTLEEKFSCHMCGTPQPPKSFTAHYLHLQIPTSKGVTTVSDLITSFFQRKSQGHHRSNAKKGESCSCDTMMVDTTLEEAPPLLMLALCRDAERENARAGSKLAVSKAVKINKEVELSLHSAGKWKTLKYTLVSIIRHRDDASGGGHYTADILINGVWTKYDDGAVIAAQDPFKNNSRRYQVRSDGVDYEDSAYILCYQMLEDILMETEKKDNDVHAEIQSVSTKTDAITMALAAYDYPSYSRLPRLLQHFALSEPEHERMVLFSKRNPPYERILVPICWLHHWVVVSIDFQEGTVTIFNSLTSAFPTLEFRTRFAPFLTYAYTTEVDSSPESVRSVEPNWVWLPNDRKKATVQVLQQEDKNSCGFIAARYLELLAMDLTPNKNNCGLLGETWSKHETLYLRMDLWLRLWKHSPNLLNRPEWEQTQLLRIEVEDEIAHTTPYPAGASQMDKAERAPKKLPKARAVPIKGRKPKKAVKLPKDYPTPCKPIVYPDRELLDADAAEKMAGTDSSEQVEKKQYVAVF